MRFLCIVLFGVSCALGRSSLNVEGKEVAWIDHRVHLFNTGETVSAGLNLDRYNKLKAKASYSGFGNYGSAGLSLSGRIGTEGFGLVCNDLSFKMVSTGSDARLDLNLSANIDCYVYLGSDRLRWWENYNLVLQLDENQLASRFDHSFGSKLSSDGNTVPLVRVSYGVGALIRSGPSMDSPPIARANFDTKLVFLGQSSRSAWLEVLLHTEDGGMVKAFVGKKLMEVLSNDSTVSEFRKTYPIPNTNW